MRKPITPTTEQQAIINLSDGKHAVFAPAGSGKTEMLSLRVKQALEQGVKPADMICLTFTNKAALNMKRRIGDLKGQIPDLDDLFIGNIHAFGAQFLFRNRLIPKQTDILDEADMAVLLNDARNEILSVDYDLADDDQNEITKSWFHFINWQNQIELGLPDDVIAKSKELLEKEFDYDHASPVKKNESQQIYTNYEKLKRDLLALDFDDILNLTLHYLTNDKIPHKSYSWMQVDEFQDLNTIQWSILKKLSKENCHIVLFGDTQQAIFSFIGADNNAMTKTVNSFKKHFIYQNHRSPQYLLELYNDYASHNLNPPWLKKPFSKENPPKTGNLVYNLIQGDQYHEMNYIVQEYILPEIESIINPIAVLAATNKQVSFMSMLCSKNEISHFPVSSFDLFGRKIIKDMMAFFNGLMGSKNRLNWVRIFALFTNSTLKVSRKVINDLFKTGIHPIDLILDKKNEMDIFNNILSKGRLIVFDTETTGLDTENDDIIQIAATEITNGKVGESLNVYMRTNKSLDKTVEIHKITPEYLEENGVLPKEGLSTFLNFIGDDPLLAHNAVYDISILNHYTSRAGVSFNHDRVILDSINITKRLFPALKSYELGKILQELNLEGSATHNAVDDVLATVYLTLHLNEENERMTPERSEFLTKYKTVIAKFQKKVTPVWQNNISKLNRNYPIYDLMDDFIPVWTKSLKREEENAFNKLKRFMKKEWKSDIPLIEFMEEKLPVYSKLKESDLIIGDESVVISTIHRAKGLEWETVIIPGCTDDSFPGYYAQVDASNYPEKSDEIIQEEARKLYVAMTRTKKKLIITRSTQKKNQYGRCFPQSISRFIRSVVNHFN